MYTYILYIRTSELYKTVRNLENKPAIKTIFEKMVKKAFKYVFKKRLPYLLLEMFLSSNPVALTSIEKITCGGMKR